MAWVPGNARYPTSTGAGRLTSTPGTRVSGVTPDIDQHVHFIRDNLMGDLRIVQLGGFDESVRSRLDASADHFGPRDRPNSRSLRA